MDVYCEERPPARWVALAKLRLATSRLHLGLCLILTVPFAWSASTQAVGLRAPEFIADLVDGPTRSVPLHGCEMDHGILFLARPSFYAPGLYFTDGTEEGTTQMGSDFAGAHATGIENFAGCGPRARYSFFDSNEINVPGTPPPAYPGVLVTDGTIAGTRPLLPPHASISSLIQFGDSTIPDGSRVLLSATDSTDWSAMSLWASDGTASGTYPLKKPNGDRFQPSGGFVEHDGDIHFVEFHADREEFWRTDGTNAGTHLVGTIPIAPGENLEPWRERADGRLLKRLDPGVFTTTIFLVTWSGELRELGTLPPGNSADDPSFANIGNRSYLLDPFSHQVWATDGTPGSLHSVYSYSDSYPISGRFTAVGRFLFFADDRAELGTELWRFDTDSSTVSLAGDLCPGPCSSYPSIESAGDRGLVQTNPDAPNWSHAYWIRPDGYFDGPLGPFCGSACHDSAIYFGDLGGSALLAAPTGTGSSGLWTLLPSDLSIHQLTDFSVWNFEIQPTTSSVLEKVAYFWGDSPETGFEPWRIRAIPDPCSPTAETLCLSAPRFSVQVDWRDFAGHRGTGHATPLTTDTGYFWFFDDANVELTVKVIDGTGFNGHYWVFFGALSNVEYWLTVEDTVTGESKQYHNELGHFGSFGDIEALPAEAPASPAAPQPQATEMRVPPLFAAIDAGSSGTCSPSATRLCILDGRFALEAVWTDFAGHSGAATAQILTSDTGYFWFFSESIVELVTKVIDGSGYNAHFWFFYGALSNVEYTLTVTDTVAGGPPRIFHNALGQFGSFGDIEAFPAP